MYQPDQTIEGTNIPVDPRKRTKNHARMEITLWADIPDEKIVGFKTAAELLSMFVTSMGDEFDPRKLPAKYFVKTSVRVSQ